MIKLNRFMTVLSLVFLVAASTAVFAQDKDHAPVAAAKAEDQAERALEAAKVLNEVMATPDKGIPEELFSRAQGIAVIPHVVKGALGIGGQYGKGLISKRLANGQWSAPAFINIGGGSFGLQLGVEATDLVLVFTDSKGVDAITKGKLKLGADASVAAGPVGRRAEAGTDVLLRSGILSYSRSKGLFAGIALDGSVIESDDSANTKVFGANATMENVLSGKATANPVVTPFVAALAKHTPAGTK